MRIRPLILFCLVICLGPALDAECSSSDFVTIDLEQQICFEEENLNKNQILDKKCLKSKDVPLDEKVSSLSSSPVLADFSIIEIKLILRSLPDIIISSNNTHIPLEISQVSENNRIAPHVEQDLVFAKTYGSNDIDLEKPLLIDDKTSNLEILHKLKLESRNFEEDEIPEISLNSVSSSLIEVSIANITNIELSQQVPSKDLNQKQFIEKSLFHDLQLSSQCYNENSNAIILARSQELDEEKNSFGVLLAKAAQQQIDDFVIYDGSYREISYPNGDVHPLYGVCSDVIIRAYRVLGIDLQELVHETVLRARDPNIDHRRVVVLQSFFSRYGETLPITDLYQDYKAGDIVIYTRPENITSKHHIAIVSTDIGPTGRPLIIHNSGWGPQQEDNLFFSKIIGHYSFSGFKTQSRKAIQRGNQASLKLFIGKTKILNRQITPKRMSSILYSETYASPFLTIEKN